MNKNSVISSVRAPLVGLTAMSLLLWGCSKPASREAKSDVAAAPGPADARTHSADLTDETLPPILKMAWKGDLDQMVKRRVVRVLVPFRRPDFFYMEGRPVGILQEAFQEFEKILNAKYKTTASNRVIVVLIPTPPDKLRDRMLAGYGDIAAYGISITPENKAAVDFTIPTITGLSIVVVTGPGAPELKTVEDLSGKDVWITPGTRMRKDLEDLNTKLKAQGKKPVVARDADPVLNPGDVMEMVNAGTYPITLMQNKTAEFWAQVFPNAKPRIDLTVAQDVEFGWAIQKGTPQLKADLDDFLKTRAAGSSFGNTLIRRYLHDVKYVKNAQDPAELRRFEKVAPLFRKHAGQYNFDYLLLIAQGYQESGLDQKVKSPVGAVGIMQVMPTTAAAAPVKIPDISSEDNNIHAGIRLMHFLVNDYFNEPALDQMNRTLLAIAAYNAGPAKITKCRRVAEEMGYDRNKWFDNVEVATAKLVGGETTQYVANIYKYYVAYRLAAAQLLSGKVKKS
ncbi:MAG TPA: transglycosylase SLT domain-containing protein [Bryobacteraceae bacterium]|nr:transglycosylase SLT domain-containing protein [Bryobacteraceae bacterium]